MFTLVSRAAWAILIASLLASLNASFLLKNDHHSPRQALKNAHPKRFGFDSTHVLNLNRG
jgi:hypothetical protein